MRILRIVIIRVGINAVWMLLPRHAARLLHGIALVPSLGPWRFESRLDIAANFDQIRMVRIIQWEIA
jgi:hypothetical protein